jgi:hypothetical protein
VALFLYWIASPFLPREAVPNVSFDWVRITAGDKTVVSPLLLGIGVSNELASLGLHGETHGGLGGFSGSGQGVPEIDVELVSLEPITKEATLALPKAGYVVYVLKGGVWIAHPSISAKDKRTLTVEPGTDPQFDGGRLRLGKKSQFSSFKWYPGIPKGQ